MEHYRTPDLSNEENRKKFDQLESQFRQRIIAAQAEEGHILRGMVESGQASDYEDALQKYLKKRETEVEVVSTGEQASKILRQEYLECVKKHMLDWKLNPDDYEVPDLQWNNDRGLLDITQRESKYRSKSDGFESWNDYISVNDVGISPDIYLIEKGRSPQLKPELERILNKSFFAHRLNVMDITRTESLEEIATDMRDLKLESAGGFYVATVSSAYNVVQGRRVISIYFNEHLLDLMTPTKKAGNLLASEKPDFVRDEFLMGGHLRSRARSMESGYPDLILKLLSGSGKRLSHSNDVLGVLVEVDVTFEKTGTGGEEALLHFDSEELVKLLAYDPEKAMPVTRVDAKTISVPVYKDVRELAAKNNGKVAFMMPVIRITPEIVSGIVESDVNGMVKKIAVQENGNFRIIE